MDFYVIFLMVFFFSLQSKAKGYDVFIPKTIVPTIQLRNFLYIKTNTLSECAARCLSEDNQRMKSGLNNCIGFRFHNISWFRNHCSFFNHGSEAITTYNKSLGTGWTVYTNSKYLKNVSLGFSGYRLTAVGSLTTNQLSYFGPNGNYQLQWIYTLGFLTTSFSVGICMVFSVSGLSFYQQEKLGSNISLTEDQGSWFVSILTIAVMVGSLLSGPLYEKIGSIWTLRISMSVKSLGWILIAIDHDFYTLIIGRCLSGLGCGLAIPAAYLVLSDITVIHFRGIIAVSNSTFLNIGFLFGLFSGAVGSLNVILFTSAVTAPLFLILSIFLPESPLWLVKRGREKDAMEVLEKLRGPDYPVNIEIEELKVCVSSDKKSGTKSLKALCKTDFLYPLIIMIAISTIQGLCGVDSISYYSVKIFQHAKVELDPYLMSIILQLGYTLGYLSIVPIMDKINRKTIFIGSGCIMSVALIILGWTSFETTPDPITDGNSTLPIRHFDDIQDGNRIWITLRTILAPLTTVIFSFSYGFGFGSVACTWSSELFPPDGKILGCSFCLSIRYIIVFILLKFYPMLFHMIGLSTLLWMHSVVITFGCFFVFFCIPETRGLSNTEISQLFAKELKDKDAEKAFVDVRESFEQRNSDTEDTSMS